jgi:hypothetical protein
MVQVLKGNKDKIVIEDYNNVSPDGIVYENSLINYPLEGVEFVNDMSIWRRLAFLPIKVGRSLIFRLFERSENNDDRYLAAVKYQWIYNLFGIFHIQDGYVKYPKKFKTNVLLEGYFQSEKFFASIREELVKTFRIEEEFKKSGYPNAKKLEERNSICISIKVQHNVGNYMYDVCHEDYYRRAIEYMTERVENPLFFICSDNVDYVKEHLIDTSKYDVVCQAAEYPVHISLAAMARCKHFIIGNTSFGWWAQYLSVNPDKIVIAPDRWYNGQGNWQYDIYMDNWIRIKCDDC